MTEAEAIPRRRLDFAFDASVVPRDWCHDDAFLTAHLNALSLLFPEGERFFVESVKQHAAAVETAGPALATAVKGFIGQEAMHGKEHRAFNEMLVAHGFAAAPTIERRLRGFLKLVRRVLSPKSQLAATCALEHFTATLAEALLANDRMRSEFDASIVQLWTWHALEENEHKAVAYDVYGAAGGGYARRVGVMVLATVVFFAYTAMVQAQLMRARGILWKPWTWLAGIGRLAVWPGHFTRLVPAYLHYYVPGFHPNKRDTSALLARWRTRLFDAQTGELTAQLVA